MGIIGCAALLSYQMKSRRMIREDETAIIGSGCVYGKTFPVVLRPNNKSTTYATVSKAPG